MICPAQKFTRFVYVFLGSFAKQRNNFLTLEALIKVNFLGFILFRTLFENVNDGERKNAICWKNY